MKRFIVALKKGTVLVLVLGVVFGALYGVSEYLAMQEALRHATGDVKAKAIEEIKNRPEFIQQMEVEAERIYYQELQDEANQNLKELNEVSAKAKRERVAKERNTLVSYLKRNNPELVAYADQIMELRQWPTVLAIAHAETGLCQAGVGESRKNCGAIKNGKTGEFKVYASEMDALWDIAYLLEEPHFKGKTISQMNGLYCVDEKQAGNKCIGWEERIKTQLALLTQ